MSEKCDNNCSNCDLECNERKTEFQVAANEKSKIKKVIGIVSGKGGVGKSFITSLSATAMQKKGYASAVLDADITGPSIPKMFGVNEMVKLDETEKFMLPVLSKSGIKIMSLNLLMPSSTDPVVWRGPVIAGAVKQFWTDVIWQDVDYMFIDMPPGTGDVPLTVFQSLPVDGIIIVSSPQQLVSMIVTKAVKMAQVMNIPIIGIVENMSYLQCPECGNKIKLFGESHIDEISRENNIELLARIPLDPESAMLCDNGKVEECNTDILENLTNILVNMQN